MSDSNFSSCSSNEIKSLLEEQSEIINDILEEDDNLNIDIQSNNKIQRQLSVEIVGEYNNKIKNLIKKENICINKLLLFKRKRKQIRDILERNINNIVEEFNELENDFRNFEK